MQKLTACRPSVSALHLHAVSDFCFQVNNDGDCDRREHKGNHQLAFWGFEMRCRLRGWDAHTTQQWGKEMPRRCRDVCYWLALFYSSSAQREVSINEQLPSGATLRFYLHYNERFHLPDRLINFLKWIDINLNDLRVSSGFNLFLLSTMLFGTVFSIH